MRFWKIALLVLSALMMGSCAKFPPSSSSTQFTQIQFTVTMAGPINPNYLYFIAIYASPQANPILTSNGPQPVIGAGSSNGFLTGEATNYISYNPLAGAQPYTVYLVGTPTDPGTDNTPTSYPVNFINPYPSTPGGDYGTQWGCRITTRDLVGTDAAAQQLTSITINIMAMNKTALGSTSGRLLDALGDTSANQFETLKIRVDSSNTVTNASAGNLEPANDVLGGYDPAIDIVDFSVQVSTP